jgi:hypothetical protein
MKKTNATPAPAPVSLSVMRHVQREQREGRAVPTTIASGPFSSPTHGPVRRAGSLVRFLDLSRPT